MTGVVWTALGSLVVMYAAYQLRHRRALHMPLMAALMLFDLGMPFYLYATRDWYTRLIEHGDITTFGVWMHLGLVFSLYALYVFQLVSVRKMLAGDAQGRIDHRGQGLAILVVRTLVVLTGAVLAESPEDARA